MATNCTPIENPLRDIVGLSKMQSLPKVLHSFAMAMSWHKSLPEVVSTAVELKWPRYFFETVRFTTRFMAFPVNVVIFGLLTARSSQPLSIRRFEQIE